MIAAPNREVAQSKMDISRILGLRRRCIVVHAFILRWPHKYIVFLSYRKLQMGLCISKKKDELIHYTYQGVSSRVLPQRPPILKSKRVPTGVPPVSRLRIRIPKGPGDKDR